MGPEVKQNSAQVLIQSLISCETNPLAMSLSVSMSTKHQAPTSWLAIRCGAALPMVPLATS